jgi:hypothetical protein
MEKLTGYEKAFIEAVLKKEKRNIESFLENNGDSFEAFFARSETLPLIEDILKKFES